MFRLYVDVPSGSVKIAIENGHRNSEFSHENRMVIFHGYVSLPEGTSHLVRGQNTNIQKLGISDIQLVFSDGTIYLRRKGKHP